MLVGIETVTILRQVETGVSAHGIPITTETETTVSGCLVSWGSVAEDFTIETNLSTDNVVIQMPINTILLSSDKLRYRGEIYLVNGTPIKWEVPAGFSIKPKLWVQAVKVER